MADTPLIDVIIPVYKGLAQVRSCLESVLSSTSRSIGDIVVVDDASPEPEMSEYLRTLANDGLVTLLVNKENQGFIGSVLNAASRGSGRDLLLLNADTVVARDWCDRLQRHLYSGPDVATVTPLSNNATIASYPVMGQENALPAGFSLERLDQLTATINAGVRTDLPTAIGFCMLIRRLAWDEIGGFDRVYGRGYGEEVDFCCAASAGGWRHVLAGDVFVYHEGSVSFGASAKERQRRAQALVDERYPEFTSLVSEWVAADPARQIRLRLDVARFASIQAPTVLFISHSLGGGVQQHVRELADGLHNAEAARVLLLQPERDGGLRLQWLQDGGLNMRLSGPDFLKHGIELLRVMQVCRIHFHHFAGLDRSILDVPSELGVPYDFTMHDYMAVCPQTYLLTSTGRYCGLPEVDICRACVSERPDPWGLGVDGWRDTFARFLAEAQRLICPTESVAAALTKFYPQLSPVVWPHADIEASRFAGHLERSLVRRKFALIGTLSKVKGADLLIELAQFAQSSQISVEFIVIGALDGAIELVNMPNVTVLGGYERLNLPGILERERPDGFLFLSAIPETYSYALSAAMATGLPIFGLDHGALGERLISYPKGTLIPPDAPASKLMEKLLESPPAYVPADKVIPIVMTQDEGDYIDRYATWDMSAGIPLSAVSDIAELWIEPVPIEREPQVEQRTMAELILAGLDYKQSESADQLRRQALENEAALARTLEHLDIRAEEVEHLKRVITELKQAHALELTDLKEHVQSLSDQLAVATNTLSHMVDVEQARDGWRAEAERLDAYLREREQVIVALANRLRDIESSVFWRAISPARWLMRKAKALVRRARSTLHRLHRVGLFVRYHYSVGGFTNLRNAISRRLRGLTHTQEDALPSHDKASMVVSELAHSPISLETSDAPLLSILIPSYGQHQTTRNCLASLAKFPPKIPFEVLLVDDAFPEPFDTTQWLVSGVRVKRNPENLGFLRSCNGAAKEARGRFLMLLNNDTLLHEDSIDALLETFERFPDAGAVGAKLLFADGVLQEAGGIVWRDASAWNWGRGENPDDPRFNYVRNVDYCSAAALMVDMAIWRDLGGFDERFAPAYYEDTDLCFAIRAAGRRVLFQPAALVTHLEGVSHGTDTSQGMKGYQLTNRTTFEQKWSFLLEQHANNAVNPMRERDRGVIGRILWVEACMLTPDQDSGSLRTLRLLGILVELGFKVTFVADNLQRLNPYAWQLEQQGIEVLYQPAVNSVSHHIKVFGDQYDIITLCRHYIAVQYVDMIRQLYPKTKIWFDTIDLHYLRLRRQFALDGKSATRALADLAYREEIAVVGKSDVTIVVSDVEVSELAKEVPGAHVAVVSNIHEAHPTVRPFEQRQHIMFVGGFQHPPNIDAVEYYATEIWPHVRTECPDVKTFIIGSKMPDTLRQFGAEHGLEMLGFVEDLEPYYHSCLMAIAPLRYGAGVKGKVNQALSYGLPVVGTEAAVEGMSLIDRKEAMVADTGPAFAAAMVELYRDKALWQTLSENGQQSLQRMFSVDVARAALMDLLSAFVRPQ